MVFRMALCAAFLTAAAPAAAVSVDIFDFSANAYKAAHAGIGHANREGFESFSQGKLNKGLTTAVGQFSSLGGKGSGGTVSGAKFANDGRKLALRHGGVHGRSSTTGMMSGNKFQHSFLDSNDTHGIHWKVSAGGSAFSRIILTLTDAADRGTALHITVGGITKVLSGLANANKQIVSIGFDGEVTESEVTFASYRNGKLATNDGFGIDDIFIATASGAGTEGSGSGGVDVAPVPLPASALLLGAGLLGLGALRRKGRPD
jgi:hypothetical protein